jgi:hypothetical protein
MGLDARSNTWNTSSIPFVRNSNGAKPEAVMRISDKELVAKEAWLEDYARRRWILILELYR